MHSTTGACPFRPLARPSGRKTPRSTPQWMTATLPDASDPQDSRMIRWLNLEIATTNVAADTFWRSIRRSRCRSEPCAVKLYGMPLSRRITQATAAGWLAKWACTWPTPSADMRSANQTALGKNASPPAQ